MALIAGGTTLLDWTADQGSTNIDTGNYTDTDTYHGTNTEVDGAFFGDWYGDGYGYQYGQSYTPNPLAVRFYFEDWADADTAGSGIDISLPDPYKHGSLASYPFDQWLISMLLLHQGTQAALWYSAMFMIDGGDGTIRTNWTSSHTVGGGGGGGHSVSTTIGTGYISFSSSTPGVGGQRAFRGTAKRMFQNETTIARQSES